MRCLRVRPGSGLQLSVLLLFMIAPSAPVLAAAPPGTGTTAVQTPPAGPAFDAAAATAAYLAKVPPEQRQRSDAYFEGGYWLILWDFLYGVAVLWLLLAAGWSDALRGLAERLTRLKWLQAGLYWAQFLVIFTVLQFPLTVYEGFFREHKYH